MHNLLGPWKERKSGVIVPDRNFSEEFPDLRFREPPVEDIALDLDRQSDYWYARSSHPDYTKLERLLVKAEAPHVGDPEGNIDAAVFSSGMAAISAVIDALAEGSDGKRFVAGKTLYYHTGILLRDKRPKNLSEAEFVDATEPEKVREALEKNKGNIAALFFETVTNPTLDVTKVREMSKLAKEYDVPVVVDNTLLTPYLQNPLMMGADIVIHSLSKYFNGMGDFLGGAVIGPYEFINDKNIGVKPLRASKGAALFPGHANEIAKRMSGLARRVDYHSRFARELAGALRKNDKVERVYYPDLGEETRDGRAGGVLSFIFKGKDEQERFEREKRFMQYATRKASTPQHKVSFGMPNTAIIGEANTYALIGRNLDEIKDILGKANIPIGLIRIGVGRDVNRNTIIGIINDAVEHAYR